MTISIGDIHLDHIQIQLYDFSFDKTVLTANSGVGKSSVIKTVLNRCYGHYSIAYVPQDVMDMFLPNIKLGKQVKILVGKIHGLAFKSYMESLNLDFEILNKKPFECSGGMLQRLAIVCALSKNAQVLILDEPTSHLDDNNAQQVAHLINKVKSKILIATHDQNFLSQIEGFNIKKLDDGGMFSKLGLFEAQIRDQQIVGEVFLPKFDFKLSLVSSSFSLIKGDSGVGKTTSLLSIKKELLKSGHKVEYLTQNAYDAFHPLKTILKSLIIEKCDFTHMSKYMTILNLKMDLLGRTPSKLSGGQLQRLQLLRALMKDASVFLCDEITSSLDHKNTKQVLMILTQLVNEKKISVLYVAHDQSLDYKGYDYIYKVSNDRIELENSDIINTYIEKKTAV